LNLEPTTKAYGYPKAGYLYPSNSFNAASKSLATDPIFVLPERGIVFPLELTDSHFT
jgi:hypothetical protein